MVLKLVVSYAHAMILVLLPYLQSKISKELGAHVSSILAKWFKPTAQEHAVDAYWDLCNECVKNASDRMLKMSNTEMDNLYYVTNLPAPSPKCKRIQADEESLDDSMSMVKTEASWKSKALKSALKTSLARNQQATQHMTNNANATMVASQTSAIFQLTEQVSQIKLENKQLLGHFDSLAAKMEQFLTSQTSPTTQCQAGGHHSESSNQT